MTPEIRLAASIDTEEDNWVPTREGLTVENIRELPRLVEAVEPLGLRPTFFATYAVASRPWALDMVRQAAAMLGGEVGAHLHPWNTPPLEGGPAVHDTMLNNYAAALQEAKLRVLTERFAGSGGERPYVFRAGRFGLGAETVRALLACGYRVDSSVTPFFTWEAFDGGPNYVGAPVHVYRLDGTGSVCRPVPHGGIIEVPISAGYTRFSPASWARLTQDLARPASRRIHLAGLGARLGIVRRVIMSPETNSVRQMMGLARRLLEAEVPFLHLIFHSSSLRPGLSPFTKSATDVRRLLDRITEFAERLARLCTVRPAPVSEIAEAWG